ncbi:MAG: DEAD/DEAH box helicase [Erysipelotrichaceae bacterium]
MKFKELIKDEQILEAINLLEYEDLMPVQEKIIPYIHEKKDVIVRAKTGSGKTAAFSIPMIEDITWEDRLPQALILAPTRELALQINEDVESLSMFKRIKTALLLGRVPYQPQIMKLKDRCHIVIGTPGRVMDHIKRGTLDLTNIRFVVLDEADQMLNMGFIEQVSDVLKRLPKERNTLLFSATMPEQIANLSSEFMNDPISIHIEDGNKANVEHQYYVVTRDEKNKIIKNILLHDHVEDAMIFASTHERVEEVYDYLQDYDISCDYLHGGLLQKDRFAVMEDFRKGKFRYLITTDVSARGIDIPALSHVIHADLPRDGATYVHRIGRCGRVDESGIAIALCEKSTLPRLEKILEDSELDATEMDSDIIRFYESKHDDWACFSDKTNVIKKDLVRHDVIKLYFNGGKNKKMRLGDFVGAICQIDGVESDDIGNIEIKDTGSYVDILHGKGDYVMKSLKDKSIKGKKLRIQKAKS